MSYATHGDEFMASVSIDLDRYVLMTKEASVRSRSHEFSSFCNYSQRFAQLVDLYT